MSAPQVGRIVNAQPAASPGTKAIGVEVTSVVSEDAHGWLVWGYRQYPHRAQRARKTMVPRQYWVPRAWVAS